VVASLALLGLSVKEAQAQGYSVSGNHILDPAGHVWQIHGVDRSGYEWSPTGDGHFTQTDMNAIAGWRANTVRIATNQDYLLTDSSCFDAGYLGRLDAALTAANQAGMNVIFDLHWTDRGQAGTCANGQQLMADNRSVTFWQIMANHYKTNPKVFFELFNEPHDISWSCWKNGCTTSGGWTAIGMQQLYNVVRNAGFSNLVLIGGLNWAFDLSGVPANRIQGINIVYATHPYDFGGKQPGDWPAGFGFLTATDPVVATELGTFDCTAGYVSTLINYMDAPAGDPNRRLGWTGWAWNVPGSCGFPSIIADWNGTPSAMAQPEHDALARYSSPPPPPSNGTALLVVGNSTLNAGDTAVNNRLTTLGYKVVVKTGPAAVSADATGKALVAVSSTVLSTDVNTKFRSVPVPVVVWEPALFDDLGLTGKVAGADLGTTGSQTQVAILDSRHPLAAGLSGTVTVTRSSQTISWGKPAASAARVAAQTSDATRVVVFGYEKGSAMVGLSAPARRVGFLLNDTTAAALTTNGWKLFDAAIGWARGSSSGRTQIRVEAGGSAGYIDTARNVWSADTGFSGGFTVDRGTIPIANTSDPRIYQTERYGMSGYAFSVPSGSYTVRLHFAETYTGITACGQRVFDVSVEGTAIQGLDVFCEAGGRDIALIKSLSVTVSDGQLNISFTPHANNAEINGIEILSAP
jgi:hypothetical protein